MECPYSQEHEGFRIKIGEIETKCKYHKKAGDVYFPSAIAPKGLCRELFYSVYPECLSVLYSGVPCRGRPRRKGKREVLASCPAAHPVKVKIRSKDISPGSLRVLKELVEEFCKKWYRPFDAPYRTVTLEVLETSPDCPKGYKVGDQFRFNTSDKKELCPAGFAALYPYLKRQEGHEGALYSDCVHCPDYVGVTYEINREQAARKFDLHCREFNGVTFTITFVYHGKEETITSEDFLPGNFCILAFNAAYPYLRTLSTGGWFNWVNYGEHVIVNCPSSDGIAMYVKTPDDKALMQVEVMKDRGGCPRKHGLKDIFVLDMNGNNALKHEMLFVALPFISRFLSGGPAAADITCMHDGETVRGRICFEKVIQK